MSVGGRAAAGDRPRSTTYPAGEDGGVDDVRRGDTAAPENTATGARRRGRRPSGEDTRATLLAAAREVFTEQGYERATVREIARRAGVDPAMVNHWFGGKAGLFTAAMSLPLDPDQIVSQLLDAPLEQLAEHMIRLFLTVWDETRGGPLIGLIRSVSSNEDAARMLREFVSSVLLDRLIGELDADHPELRAALCGSQIIGLGVTRYVLRLEPLASADHDTVVAAIAPNLQRYLTGDLDVPPDGRVGNG